MTASLLLAQSGMSISEAVDLALRNYPSVKVSQEQMNAAAAGIRLARAAWLPRVDGLAQLNRATRNNIFGLLLPQSVIPSISGPVLGTNNLDTVWGSAAGMLVSWEPFDFGLRRANFEAASAARARSEAGLSRTNFDVAVATADAFLTTVAAQETVRSAQAALDRAETLHRVVAAQVNAGLRPGADQSRAGAEVAASRTGLIQAREAVEIARITVAKFTGGEISIRSQKLLTLPAFAPSAALEPAANPIAREQDAALKQAEAQMRALQREYFPRFALQAAAYARGTGAPITRNYALGFSVSFPVMDFASVRAREAAQSANIRAEQARYRQITTDLMAQWNAARATLEGARRVAKNTPTQVAAAKAAVQQATARYQAGLGTIADVADAQRLLTQSEIDDALARLGVWRALLQLATAQGDIQPFLMEASQ